MREGHIQRDIVHTETQRASETYIRATPTPEERQHTQAHKHAEEKDAHKEIHTQKYVHKPINTLRERETVERETHTEAAHSERVVAQRERDNGRDTLAQGTDTHRDRVREKLIEKKTHREKH